MHRYDLLCLEGLVQALRIFIGLDEIPTYKFSKSNGESILRMNVKPEVLILQQDLLHSLRILEVI